MTTTRDSAHARELLVENLGLIETIIRSVSRRMLSVDSEDLKSHVMLRLVENDYAVLRKYEAGRSTFNSFISVVVQRTAFDLHVQRWGKWHTSAEAKRLGPIAVELERLLHREHRTLDEALAFCQKLDPDLSREQLERIAERLPSRTPRPREVSLDEAAWIAHDPDDLLSIADTARVTEHVASILRKFLAGLTDKDRLALQFRFEKTMTVAQIARILQIDQKRLYRRLDSLLQRMREELEAAGVHASDLSAIIGNNALELDFGLTARRELKPGADTEGDEDVHPTDAPPA